MASFILRGTRYDFEKKDVENAVKGALAKGKKPGPIFKYAVNIKGEEWPIKQIVEFLTKQSRAEFTAHDAYRVLRKIGYPILNYD